MDINLSIYNEIKNVFFLFYWISWDFLLRFYLGDGDDRDDRE